MPQKKEDTYQNEENSISMQNRIFWMKCFYSRMFIYCLWLPALNLEYDRQRHRTIKSCDRNSNARPKCDYTDHLLDGSFLISLEKC